MLLQRAKTCYVRHFSEELVCCSALYCVVASCSAMPVLELHSNTRATLTRATANSPRSHSAQHTYSHSNARTTASVTLCGQQRPAARMMGVGILQFAIVSVLLLTESYGFQAPLCISQKFARAPFSQVCSSASVLTANY